MGSSKGLVWHVAEGILIPKPGVREVEVAGACIYVQVISEHGVFFLGLYLSFMVVWLGSG